jgi:hypothetical protein
MVVEWKVFPYLECEKCEFTHLHWEPWVKRYEFCCDKKLNRWDNLKCPGKEAEKASEKNS